MKKHFYLIIWMIFFVLSCLLCTNLVYHLAGEPPVFGQYDFFKLHHPFKLAFWMVKFSVSNNSYKIGIILLAALSLVDTVCCITLFYRFSPAKGKTYGSSRWLTNAELKKAGFLAESGVVLGQRNTGKYKLISKNGSESYKRVRDGKLIFSTGPEHVAIIAPTRRGKGINNVIPTLLSWLDSVIVYDIKKENFNLTSGWRRLFSNVLRFEPTSLSSVKFNPLFEISMGVNEVSEVQNLVEILADPNGEGKNDHWSLSAKAFLVGVILHILYAEEDKSLKGVYDFINNPNRSIESTLSKMLTTPHVKGEPHETVASAARSMLNKGEQELPSVVSTASSYLALYADPVIGEITRSSDFRLSDLVDAHHPCSLYLVVNPNDETRLKPLTRLMLVMIGRKLTQTSTHKHKLCFLIDEFPSLGKLEFFETNLAFFAGYGIKCCLIAQGVDQIKKHYGVNNSILTNCRHKVYLGVDDIEQGEYVSKSLGAETITRQSTSKSGKASAFFHSNESISSSEVGRNLLTADEVARLDFREILITFGGFYPYKASKIMYYLQPRFKTRLVDPLPEDEQADELPEYTPSEWEALQVNEDIVEESSPAGDSFLVQGKNIIEEGSVEDHIFYEDIDQTPDEETDESPDSFQAKTEEEELVFSDSDILL